ncbi:enoyl-CoA hydratase-related protein [Halobellus sp. GM3]|uniref:enoyl-CoA hydratase-related protein n=1 Tax=Halobellus sp. GM3 TaxID=3458410 RepID=UPI00403E1EDE
MASYETIEVVVDEDIGRISLDRPEKRNAISPQVCLDLNDALLQMEDSKAQVVVLSGRGEAFCAGMDLEEYFIKPSRESPEAMRQVRNQLKQALLTLRNHSLPTIASVDGWTTGGGFVLQALCDFTIATEDSTFVLSEINFGIIPAGGAMWTLVNTLPLRDAMYYSATGEEFSGEEADRMRAINRCVPSGELDESVARLADKLIEKNSLALEYNKRVLQQMQHMGFEEGMEYATAKVQELKNYQGDGGMRAGLEQFESREFKPGKETFDDDR